MTNQLTNNALSTKYTRRTFIKAAGAGAAWIALTGTLGCEPSSRNWASGSPPAPPGQVWAFRSRPDLSPPVINVATRAHDNAPGYIFVAPKWGGAGQGGSMILDNSGRAVWFRPTQGTHERAMNLKVQTYRGKPVLTWGKHRAST